MTDDTSESAVSGLSSTLLCGEALGILDRMCLMAAVNAPTAPSFASVLAFGKALQAAAVCCSLVGVGVVYFVGKLCINWLN